LGDLAIRADLAIPAIVSFGRIGRFGPSYALAEAAGPVGSGPSGNVGHDFRRLRVAGEG
jgi:hypothetical protein